MKTEAIVVAAGVGKRLQTNTRKPYLRILGKPILIHTLETLNSSSAINGIIVVVNRFDRKRCLGLIKKYNVKKIKAVIAGGKERMDSVYNGLKGLDKNTDVILIHDGVRPFVNKVSIKKSIGTAKKYGACVVGVPVKATIKKIKNQKSKTKIVDSTVDRQNLWEIQTPQVFKKDLILEAYKKFRNIAATDDAMLVEKLGVEVGVVLGSYKNIKITTAEDLIIAKAIMTNDKTQIPK